MAMSGQDDAHHSHCASCGAALRGPWCAQCGERQRRPGDLTVREYLSELVDALTNLEGRFLGSLRALIFRPSLLTTEFMAGRRVRWMRPLHLFLLINLVYFFLSSWNTFSTPLAMHLTMNNFPHRAVAESLVNRAINEPTMEGQTWSEVVGGLFQRNPPLDEAQLAALDRLREYARDFDRRVEVYSRTLIIILIPLFALLPMLVFARRRDGPVRHLVFSTHWMSLFLIVSLLGSFALGVLYRFGSNHDALLFEDLIVGSVMMLVMVVWTAPAARRTYELAWWRAGLLALALALWMILMLQVYRMILFFLVFWTL